MKIFLLFFNFVIWALVHWALIRSTHSSKNEKYNLSLNITHKYLC